MSENRDEIRRLILEALDRHHFSLSELGRRSRVSHATLSKLQNRQVQMSPTTARKLAPWLGITADRLLEHAGHRAPAGERQPSRDELLDRYLASDATEVEYYEMVEASASSVRRLLNGDPAGYRFLPDRGRFAKGRIKVLRVWGDCMEPSVRDGEDIYVDTRGELEPNAVVLAALGDDTLVVKRLRAVGDGWELAPDNGGPAIPVASEDHILGVVIGVWRRVI